MKNKGRNNFMNKKITGLWGKDIKPVGKVEVEEKEEKEETDNLDEERVTKKAKKKEEKKTSSSLTYPTTLLRDLGGIENCVEEILELIALPLLHPEIYLHTGIPPPRGILLHGPPGCGKTMLASAIAGELSLPLLQISAPSVVSGMSGESEKKLRNIFDEAKKVAPCILFLDEIDAITPKRETAQREMERRIVAQLLTCLDDLAWDKTNNKPVIVIGATNRPDSLDAALRRAGRFDREIALGVPDEKSREKILKVLCNKLKLNGNVDFKNLAKNTPGYVGADLKALTSTAGMFAVKRIFELLKEGKLEFEVEETDKEENINENIQEIDGNKDQQTVDENSIVLEKNVNEECIDLTQGEDIIAEKGTKNENKVIENNVKIDKVIDNGIKIEYKINFIEEDITLSTIQKFLRKYPNTLSHKQLEPISIIYEDFLLALTKVQPSSKREGFATVPDVTFDDIGALSKVRDELRMAIVEPMIHPHLFEAVGITAPAGVLLWGPPGCGKTLLAKAVANQTSSNFISVKGPELLNKYVGESERAIRQVFQRARASQPCVVFFDELDALCTRRDENQSEVSARVVNTLLTELDGMEARKQVFIVAATNRPDIIDPAMLRPGRLDKLLYVELPTPPERIEILKALSKKTPLDEQVDLRSIANHKRCEGFSGADLASLLREAAVTALRRNLDFKNIKADEQVQVKVNNEDFQTAFEKVGPSVTQKDKLMFEQLKPRFGSS